MNKKMCLILSPETAISIKLADSDGEIVVEYGKEALTINADMPDSYGRADEIYREELTSADELIKDSMEEFEKGGGVPLSKVQLETSFNKFSLNAIPKLPERRDDTAKQIQDLLLVAERLGMRSAADAVRNLVGDMLS